MNKYIYTHASRRFHTKYRVRSVIHFKTMSFNGRHKPMPFNGNGHHKLRRGRKSKISDKLDFTGHNAVMVVGKKSNRMKKPVKKDCSKCRKMLPVTNSLDNSIDILENLSRELIHVGDSTKSNMGSITLIKKN